MEEKIAKVFSSRQRFHRIYAADNLVTTTSIFSGDGNAQHTDLPAERMAIPIA